MSIQIEYENTNDAYLSILIDKKEYKTSAFVRVISLLVGHGKLNHNY